MATGNELVIGFLYPDWHIVEEGVGFKMPRTSVGSGA